MHTLAWALIGMLATLTMLEATFAFCVGCKIYTLLIRTGMIAPAVCETCASPPAHNMTAPQNALGRIEPPDP